VLAGMSMLLHSLIQDFEFLFATLKYATRHRLPVATMPATGGSGETSGQAAFILPASKQVIASRLNLSPETLSRIFAELSRAGLIDVDGRAVKVSAVTQLREYGL